MSLHLADGFTNFATFFVPAVLLAWADYRRRPRPTAPDQAATEEDPTQE